MEVCTSVQTKKPWQSNFCSNEISNNMVERALIESDHDPYRRRENFNLFGMVVSIFTTYGTAKMRRVKMSEKALHIKGEIFTNYVVRQLPLACGRQSMQGSRV